MTAAQCNQFVLKAGIPVNKVELENFASHFGSDDGLIDMAQVGCDDKDGLAISGRRLHRRHRIIRMRVSVWLLLCHPSPVICRRWRRAIRRRTRRRSTRVTVSPPGLITPRHAGAAPCPSAHDVALL